MRLVVPLVGSLIVHVGCRKPQDTDGPDGNGTVVDDSGPDDTDDPPLEPIWGPGLEQHGVQVCKTASERDELGAFELSSLGPEWAYQTEDYWYDDPFLFTPGVTVGDFNDDGVYDVVLSNKNPLLYLSTPKGWTDASATHLPKAGNPFTMSTTAVDFDGDGDVDLAMANYGHTVTLYENDGTATFTDVTAGSGLPGESRASQATSWGDLDGDGDLDMFVANRMYRSGPYPPDDGQGNWLFENMGNGELADRTDVLGSDALRGYTFLAGLLDFDSDGDVDIYVINDFGSTVVGNQYLENQLAQGEDAWTFANKTADYGLGIVGNAMGLGVGDLNGDVCPDLVVTDADARLHVLESASGLWFDAADARGITVDSADGRSHSWGAELVDLDNDGDADLPVVFGWNDNGDEENPLAQPDAVFIQQSDGSFVQQAEEMGLDDDSIGRGLLAVDFNRDGWLDLFTRSLDEKARYYQARCGDSAWVQVELVGKAPNTQAAGARVTIEAGDRTWQRWISVGSHSLNVSGPPVAHFGLGDLDEIDRLTVTWPDASTSVYQVIETRQWLTVTQQ